MNIKKPTHIIIAFLFLTVLVMAVMLTGCERDVVTLDGIELSPIGDGEKNFVLTVTDKEGNISGFSVSTNEDTVGKALEELNIIRGEDGPYGLYVTAVLDMELDFDRDNKYWAFYIDGTYATSGIDKTEIRNGAHYALKAE